MHNLLKQIESTVLNGSYIFQHLEGHSEVCLHLHYRSYCLGILRRNSERPRNPFQWVFNYPIIFLFHKEIHYSRVATMRGLYWISSIQVRMMKADEEAEVANYTTKAESMIPIRLISWGDTCLVLTW